MVRWLVLDREVFNLFSQTPFYKWGQLTDELTQKRGTNFESQALPLIINGEISFDRFIEVVKMTIAESIVFFDSHGLLHLVPPQHIEARKVA